MYDTIIPIGAWCQVGEQLTQHNIEYLDSPFLWTVTPMQSLLDILRDGGRSLGLAVERVQNNDSVQCLNYGILHHHDFPRDPANNAILPIEQKDLLDCRSKFLHKMEGFVSTCRQPGRKLFLRLGGEGPAMPWPYYPDPVPLRHSRVNELVRALETLCGSQDFTLGFLWFQKFMTMQSDEPFDARVISIALPDPISMNWSGDREAWTGAFARLSIV